MKKSLIVFIILPFCVLCQEKKYNFHIYEKTDSKAKLDTELPGTEINNIDKNWLADHYFDLNEDKKKGMDINQIVNNQIDSLNSFLSLLQKEYNEYNNKILRESKDLVSSEINIKKDLNYLKNSIQYKNYLLISNYISLGSLPLGHEFEKDYVINTGLILKEEKLIKKMSKYDNIYSDYKIVFSGNNNITIISISIESDSCYLSSFEITDQSKSYDKILKLIDKKGLLDKHILQNDIFSLIDLNALNDIQNKINELSKDLELIQDKKQTIIVNNLSKFNNYIFQRNNDLQNIGIADYSDPENYFFPNIEFEFFAEMYNKDNSVLVDTKTFLDSINYLVNTFYVVDTLCFSMYYNYYKNNSIYDIISVLHDKDSYIDQLEYYVEDSTKVSKYMKSKLSITSKIKSMCKDKMKDVFVNHDKFIFDSYENVIYDNLQKEFPCVKTVICNLRKKDGYGNVIKYAFVVALKSYNYDLDRITVEDFVLINKSDKGTIEISDYYTGCYTMAWHSADSPQDPYIGSILNCVFNDHIGKESYAAGICRSIDKPNINDYLNHKFYYFNRNNFKSFTEYDSFVDSNSEEKDAVEGDIFMVVETMPTWPGCDYGDNECTQIGIMKFLKKNVKYPEIAKEYNITGRVYVQFVVDKKGFVNNVKILRGVDKHLDNEALRAVKSFPRFTPGRQQGRKVNVMYTVPVNFNLD